MPKYHLVSDVLQDLVIDVNKWRWGHLQSIIQREWADGKIEILRIRPDSAVPEVWEPAQQKLTIISIGSGKRWIKCAVYQGIKEIFEDPFISEEDVQYVKEMATAAGLVLAEQSTDRGKVHRLQTGGPSNAASISTVGAPKRAIPKRVLSEFSEEVKAQGGPVPAADRMLIDVRNNFPSYHVTRDDVRTIHKEVFGKFGPGKRQRCG